MSEERRYRSAGNRDRCCHGAVSVVRVVEYGGEASLGHWAAASLTARPGLSAVRGGWAEPEATVDWPATPEVGDGPEECVGGSATLWHP